MNSIAKFGKPASNPLGDERATYGKLTELTYKIRNESCTVLYTCIPMTMLYQSLPPTIRYELFLLLYNTTTI